MLSVGENQLLAGNDNSHLKDSSNGNLPGEPINSV